ncbi:MAG: phosphoribosylamine--glycine ligase [Actinomycetaceae bacterium]|nr:phosphoribosylamine--glycine ligase [Actinomycetaceae bacterium]MDY6083350.1 phosphoribosylamine--glycine ligase [Actinomycetaceae bacterium]
MMKVLVVGGGGRENVIVRKIAESPRHPEIFVAPGNAGMADVATLVDIDAMDLEGIVSFASTHAIDYCVVAPDDPLAAGLVDRLEDAGVPCFGPTARAAHIEASKAYAKSLMAAHRIPTAHFQIAESPQEALSMLKNAPYPTVIKADGLALGKGVMVVKNFNEAELAIRTIMEDKKFGDSGNRVVIEEYLEGPEVSVLAFTDGHSVVPMVSSMDHKAAYDSDKGPNTGGMGAIAPNPFYSPEIAQRCMEEIFIPTIAALNAVQRQFKGCLYFGLMLTKDGPKVIEYNARFGDPEAQVVLPLLKTDLLTVMQAVTEERLADIDVEFSDESACCVVLASQGYPLAYESGKPLTIDPEAADHAYVAGAIERDGTLYTHGGRVVGVTAVADTLQEAIDGAYRLADGVHFENKYARHDIGARALRELESQARRRHQAESEG